MTDLNLTGISQDLTNWIPMRDLPATYPQFSASSIKTMFWKRDQTPGLSRCSRMVGNKLFINTKLFGLWLAGELPEQQG